MNKWLGQMGICSRREADRLIEEGKVLVDGRKAAVGQKVSPGQRVICNGEVVQGGRDSMPEPVLLVVNKPKGIVCTTSNKDRAENIVEYLKYPERIYPVGRLDKDSEGLLLMTNQGGLVNKIMRSGNAHEKEYIVRINKAVTPEFLRRMSEGVELKELGEVTRPCKTEKVDEKTFSIVLTQGLNRQIRRMCEACGCEVQSLKRVRIMNIRLGSLRTGAYRKINGAEYNELLKLLRDSSSLPAKDRDKQMPGAGITRDHKTVKAGSDSEASRRVKTVKPGVDSEASRRVKTTKAGSDSEAPRRVKTAKPGADCQGSRYDKKTGRSMNPGAPRNRNIPDKKGAPHCKKTGRRPGRD